MNLDQIVRSTVQTLRCMESAGLRREAGVMIQFIMFGLERN